MKKSTKELVPLDVTVEFYFNCDYKEVIKDYSELEDDLKDDFLGIQLSIPAEDKFGVMKELIFIPEFSNKILIHELMHVVDSISEHYGILDTEYRAYLIEYLFDLFTETKGDK